MLGDACPGSWSDAEAAQPRHREKGRTVTTTADPPKLPPEPPPPPAELSPARQFNPQGLDHKPWWRRAQVLPPAFLSLIFLVYALPPYLGFDPAKARITNLRTDIWWHYPALNAHIMVGAIATIAVVFQLWPWMRENHPRAHRIIGRIYVYAGVLPSGILALFVMPFSGGPVGNTMEGICWLLVTFVAVRAARQRRFPEHRRWMFFSYAFCIQIIWGRLLIISLGLFAPNVLQANFPLVLETASWIGTFINIVIAQWWLERQAKRGIPMWTGQRQDPVPR
jgi:uncharacterized membrane protein